MRTIANQSKAENGAPATTSPAKHRACDECRSRKLACTKEPDGCSRCSREGIACHYSAQKQMGRPRKKPNPHGAGGQPAPTVQMTTPVGQDSSVPNPQAPPMAAPDMLMDLDPSPFSPAIDPDLAGSSDAGLLGLLGPDFISTQPFHAQEWLAKVNPLERDIWSFDINFDNPHPSSPLRARNPDTGAQPPPSTGFSTPSPSSKGITTPENPNLPATPAPGTCGCLASLYLALDALTNLPTEVEPAIQAARGAAKAAHASTQCTVCCPPLTETMTIGISSFQNMMILGALFPAVVDAYSRILDMIEIETARAICERRQMHFSLPVYGGLMSDTFSSDFACTIDNYYGNVTLEPAMWRLTVRALLKTDVYGVNCGPDGPGTKALRHSQVGLKDIAAQLEARSNARHAEVDALIEAGLPGPVGPLGMRAMHSRDGDPHCKRIIKIAKDAIASLDIP